MIKVDLKKAERHLGRLIEKATAGQEVVIANAGGRMVRLVPIPQKEAWKSNESKATKTVGHALDRFMGTWTAEQEAEVLEAVEFLDHLDKS
jgi:prevent-host-death family protein